MRLDTAFESISKSIYVKIEMLWESILYNSRKGNMRGFYLASAGEDGLFDCLFSDDVNDDNIINVLRD